MIMRLKKIFFSIFLIIFLTHSLASVDVALSRVDINTNNQTSLKNGAKLFMDYCSGCHSLKYMRYSRLAKDLHIDKNILTRDFIFTGQKPGDTIKVAMPKKTSEKWFGITPPDLSLTARSKGVDWIYSYLNNFYPDTSRPFGVNNRVLKNAAMPDVLVQIKNKLTPDAFEDATRDITNFLNYVSEPAQLKRYDIGFKVIAFLFVLLILSYLLKKEYWKDVKYGKWRIKK